MNMLVFGKGWLGNRIASHFGGTLSDADILDTNEVLKVTDWYKPDVVVNAAGKCGSPNIDWCEAFPENEKLTMHVNAYGPAILQRTVSAIAHLRNRSVRFVHLSSGCIWERGQDITEMDHPAPPSLYAKSKAIGESGLNKDKALILRLRMPVSGEVHPRNLISKLAKYRYVLDEPNSVTVVEDMLLVLAQLLEKEATGIFHVVNPGAVTGSQIMDWYTELVDQFHRHDVATMQELKDGGLIKAGRSNVTLSCAKLESLGIVLPPAMERVRECLCNYAVNLGKRRSDGQTASV